ncbi:VWA domain-containing protein [Saccharibacillus sacchari]|uniref:VWA domain-containing protein n=1 Tax=Saccharibacillus sacchari TaxID=456493 RepID=A0ACC6PIU4_9BACL
MGIGSWAGLWFALGIPLILMMYLLKRKFIDTPVPSHLLWRRVLENTEANRPWQKLRNRLLMWLQILAAALLAFALMRPFLWTDAGTGGTLVVVADVSASMSAIYASEPGDSETAVAPTRLDILKSEILADTRQADGDLTLIRMGGSPQVVASAADDQASWNRAVEELEPDYARTSYREAISLASAVAEGQQDARIIVYTDGQWSERVEDLPVSVPVEVRRIGGERYRNASIEQFGTDGNRAVGVVANTGNSVLEVGVELSGDGRAQGKETLALQPGERQTVTFDRAEAAEVYRLSLAGLSDDYAADDDAFAFPESGGAVKVLLLSDGNLFLEKALRLSGAEVTRLDLSGNAPTADTEASDTEEGAGKTESTAPPLPEEQPDIVVVEGELPASLRSGTWGQWLGNAARWTIGGKEEAGQPGNRRVELTAHPITRYLSLTEPYFGPLTEGRPAGLQTLLSIGGRPAIAAGTENGQRALWFGFNLQSGDLPLNSEFPVLVSNATTWLSGGRGGGLGRAISGAVVEVPIATGAESALWRPLQGAAFEKNGGATQAVNGNPTSGSGEHAGLASSQVAPSVPGLYAFEQSGNGLEEAPVYLLDVRADASESTAPTAENPVFGAMAATGTTGVSDDMAPNTANGDHRSRLPLTIPLAALIIAIMLTEWGVYRRGRSI